MRARFRELRKWLPGLSARFHLSFGLSSLLSSVVLASVFAGFTPHDDSSHARSRLMLTEAVAASAAIMLEQDTLAGMRQMLEFIVNRDTSLERITLHRERDNSRRVFVTDPTPDGTSATASSSSAGTGTSSSADRRRSAAPVSLVSTSRSDAADLPSPAVQPSRAVSRAAKAESPTDSAESTDASLISVPLMRGGRPWGHLILDFVDATNGSPLTWIRQSPFGQILFIGLLSFPLFYLYLGKMLNQLNPSTAVPGRVRSALDTIAESLLS